MHHKDATGACIKVQHLYKLLGVFCTGGDIFYLTTHTATLELSEIRYGFHSVLVFLLLSVDMQTSLCAFIECGFRALTACGIQIH